MRPARRPAASPSSAPQLGDPLAYAKVVETFNLEEAVVPMRFGCRFPTLVEVRAWLRRNAAELHALLRRVDGCVEMGVRALLLETSPARRLQILDI